MKKLFISILAVAAAVACTKTNVDFEQPAEIGFAPVASMSSKAALNTTTYPTDQPIGIWSNYAGDVNPATVSDYTKFATKYLDNVKFINRTTVVEDKETATANWGGATPYYWPTNGSLVFAGYSIPKDGNTITTAEEGDAADAQTVSYDFSTDKMVFKNYVQSHSTASTFDLLWFGRTADSYNYRNASTAVPVKFQHALSWITIKVMGDVSSASQTNPWKITSVVLNDVYTVGDAELVASATTPDSPITWNNRTTPEDMTIYTGSQALGTVAETIETNANGTVVIPQKPLSLTVNYEYISPAKGLIKDSKPVSLQLTAKENDTNNVWMGGVHYTYTLIFKSTEILVAPTVETWTESVVPGVTVE